MLKKSRKKCGRSLYLNSKIKVISKVIESWYENVINTDYRQHRERKRSHDEIAEGLFIALKKFITESYLLSLDFIVTVQHVNMASKFRTSDPKHF